MNRRDFSIGFITGIGVIGGFFLAVFAIFLIL